MRLVSVLRNQLFLLGDSRFKNINIILKRGIFRHKIRIIFPAHTDCNQTLKIAVSQ